MLGLISAGGARFAPRERIEHNNSNYLLLGYVLEKVQARSYDDILRRQIIDKLGLAAHLFRGHQRLALEALPYRAQSVGLGAQWNQTDPVRALGGAAWRGFDTRGPGAFIDALFAGKLVSAQQPGHACAARRRSQPARTVAIRDRRPGGLGHAGSIDGFRPACITFPRVAFRSRSLAMRRCFRRGDRRRGADRSLRPRPPAARRVAQTGR